MHVRACLEQPRLQVPERRADFVHHRRPILTNFARQPQQLHLALEGLLDQPDFVGGRRLAGEQTVGNTCLQAEQRATRRFSWMCSKHRSDPELEHRLLNGVCAHTERAQLTHRPASGGRLWIRRRSSEVRVSSPDPVRLLGGVDEQKEQRKRARRHRAVLYGEPVDLSQQLVETRRPGVAVTARPCRYAKLFNDLEGLLSIEPPDDSAESAGKPTNIFVQRKVFFSRRSRRWHGRKIPQTAVQPPALPSLERRIPG